MNPAIKYAFAALLLLGSTFSHADTGKIWTMSDAVDGSLHYGDTHQKAFDSFCSAYSNCAGQCGSSTTLSATSERYHYNYYTPCSPSGSSSRDATLSTMTCPSGYPYVDDSGNCTTEEPVTCTAGQLVINMRYPNSDNQGPINYQGCEVNTSGLATCNISVLPEDNGAWMCISDGVQTGNPESTGAPEIDTGELSSDYVDDNRQSTKDKTVSSTPPETAPDGTITETSTETTIQTQNQGGHVVSGDNTISIYDSDGTVTTYTENKTTVTHPDGSITETINKDTSTDTGNQTVTNVDKSTGSVTTTNTTNVTNNYNKTVINNYDSDGNLTSSEEVESGTGDDGEEGDPAEEGNCGAPGQPPCDVVVKDTSSDYQDYADSFSAEQAALAAQRQQVVDDLADTSNDYGLSTISNFSVEALVTGLLPLPTSYSCNGISTTFLDGMAFSFEPCEDLAPLREVLAWVFFILTLFAVLNIMLGRRLF